MASTGHLSISYDYLADVSEEYGPDPGGAVAVLTVQTSWNEFNLRYFPGAVMGTQAQVGTKISRTAPEAHPLRSELYAINCKLKNGVGALRSNSGNGMPEFYDNPGGGEGKAVWEIAYGYLGYNVVSDEATYEAVGATGEINRYVRKRSKPTIEALPVQGATWKFTGTTKRFSETLTKLFPMTALEYTWFWVPHPLNTQTWRTAMGKVNGTAFDPLHPGANYAIETVFFAGYEKEPIMDANGQLCSHVTFRFLVRKGGWNKFYRGNKAGGPDFESVVSYDAAAIKPYASVTLNNLFTAP